MWTKKIHNIGTDSRKINFFYLTFQTSISDGLEESL